MRKEPHKVNHLLYPDDLKLIAINDMKFKQAMEEAISKRRIKVSGKKINNKSRFRQELKKMRD